MTEKTRFTLDVPKKFLKEFDEAIIGDYNTRAEAIRAAMRILLNNLKEK